MRNEESGVRNGFHTLKDKKEFEKFAESFTLHSPNSTLK